MKLDFINYTARINDTGLHLDKVCTFLYKEYIDNTQDTHSDPLIDSGFNKFLNSIDPETNLPVYIRKLYEILPDIFCAYTMRNVSATYDDLINLIKENFPYDGVVSLETMIQLRNQYAGIKYSVATASVSKIKHNKSEAISCEPISNAKSFHALYLALLSLSTGKKASNSLSDHKILFHNDRIEITNGIIRICIPHIDEAGNFLKTFDINKCHYTELWVPDDHYKEQLTQKHGLDNIRTMPHPVLKPSYEPSSTSLPNNKFTVILRHDFSLEFAMQNSLASLLAFQKAFKRKNDVLIICFVKNASPSDDYDKLISAFTAEKNAVIVEGAYNESEYYSYLHHADCLICLHQGAIFEYALAEALSLGKYIIATNKVGDAHYMNPENNYLINSLLDARKITEAAKILVSIYNDSDNLSRRSKEAKLYVQKHLSPNSIGFMMQKRINELVANGGSLQENPFYEFKKMRIAYYFLRDRFKKIPAVVTLYIKLKGIKARLKKIPAVVTLHMKLRMHMQLRIIKARLKKIPAVVTMHIQLRIIKARLKKIPAVVTLYMKLKRIKTSTSYLPSIEQNQANAVIKILLKNANRPAVLE